MTIRPSLPEATSTILSAELPTPGELRTQLPARKALVDAVAASRTELRRILSGESTKFLVIVGPCSVHCVEAAVEFARRLHALTPELPEIFPVMRCYFSKPRTTTGWKGLVLDPTLDETGEVEHGLELSRRVLLEISELIPCASEILDLSHLYISDLLTWGAVGARTVESQVHREWASFQDFPVGFKNATSGEVATAVEACVAANVPHVAIFPDPESGKISRFRSSGNSACHVVLRGGRSGPNFRSADLAVVSDLCRELNAPVHKVVIDCSHGNSGKLHQNQLAVLNEVVNQLVSSPAARIQIAGVMLEAFLEEGRQDISANMTFGKSITDACLGWSATEAALRNLNSRLQAIAAIPRC